MLVSGSRQREQTGCTTIPPVSSAVQQMRVAQRIEYAVGDGSMHSGRQGDIGDRKSIGCLGYQAKHQQSAGQCLRTGGA